MFEKIGNMAPSTKIPLDAAAVAAGYAVWAKDVPIWVGIITIVWLGMQIIINLPRLWNSCKLMCIYVRSLFRGK